MIKNKIVSKSSVSKERIARVTELMKKNTLTATEIGEIGTQNALRAVGGKNFNCAILSTLPTE